MSVRVTDYTRAFFQFNRVTPVRYFAVDIAIFCFPLVLGAQDQRLGALAVLGLASWLFVRGSALTLDDYFDAESDAIEKAHRPIPSGRVTKRQALGFALVMLAAGIGLALFVGPLFSIAVVLLLVILASDPLVFNELGLPGVSTLVTITSVSTASAMGWLVYGDPGLQLLIVFATTWVWDLSHDTIGAYLDRDGDKQANIRSFGRDLSRRAIAIIVGSCNVVFLYLLGSLVGSSRANVLLAAFGVVVLATTAGFGLDRVSPRIVRKVVEWNVVVSYTTTIVVVLVGGQ